MKLINPRNFLKSPKNLHVLVKIQTSWPSMFMYRAGRLNDRLAMSFPSTNCAKLQYFRGLSVAPCSVSIHSLTESYFSPSIVLIKSCPSELRSSTILSEFCNSLPHISEFSGESMWPISELSDRLVESKMSLSMCPVKRQRNYPHICWINTKGMSKQQPLWQICSFIRE